MRRNVLLRGCGGGAAVARGVIPARRASIVRVRFRVSSIADCAKKTTIRSPAIGAGRSTGANRNDARYGCCVKRPFHSRAPVL